MTLGISRVLVTGGAGFIGSQIVDKLLGSGFEVTVLDNLSAGKLENIASHQSRNDFHFIKGDVGNFDLVKNVLKDIDAVFHEAALVSVTGSVENPTSTNEVNVTGTLVVLKACVDSDVRRFIYASSSSVYGDTETLPKHERLTPQPISPYAVARALESIERSE